MEDYNDMGRQFKSIVMTSIQSWNEKDGWVILGIPMFLADEAKQHPSLSKDVVIRDEVRKTRLKRNISAAVDVDRSHKRHHHVR